MQSRIRSLRTALALPLVLLVSLVAVACGAPEAPADDATANVTGEADSPTFVLVHSSQLVPGSAITHWDEFWHTEIDERTGGRVQVEANWGASLYSMADTLEAVGRGDIDLGFLSLPFFPDQLPLTSLFEMPFVTQHSDAAMRAFRQLYEEFDALRSEYEDRNNVRVVTVIPPLPPLIGFDRDISGLEDLAGLQVRSFGLQAEALEAVGATPVAMGFPEVYPALQTGVVDGAAGASLDDYIGAGLHEVAPYVLDPRFGFTNPVAVVMNLDTWLALPEDVQAISDQIAEDILSGAIEMLLEAQSSRVDEAADVGIELIELSDSDYADWQERTTAVWENRLQSIEDLGLPGRELFDTYQSLVSELEAGSIYVGVIETARDQQPQIVRTLD